MSAIQMKPKRVLVIGGGPTGLVTLRNLTARGNFEHVELVERRDDIGGVWYLDNPNNSPQASGRPRWPSPAYPGLIGNVLPEFLSFSEFPFPERPSKDQPFPTLTETHEYLRAFAQPYINAGVIRLNTEVVSVEELEEGAGWKVVYIDWTLDGKQRVETWDAVVVSIGWYDHPVWPNTLGLDELRDKDLAKHAKWWRGSSEYGGKRVLVVGNANSSNDMAAQLAPVALEPVYHSIRRPAFPDFPSLPDGRIAMVAPVAKYTLKSNPEGDKLKFDVLLTDGKEIKDLDYVHFGTGYKPVPHFIRVLRGPKGSSTTVSLDTLLESDAHPRVPCLHRCILYAHNPSLAFVGAALAYTPFTIADVASTWLALAWSGSISYPDTPDGRLVFESKRLEAVNKWRSGVENPSSLMVYSVLGMYEQEYASSLKEDIVRVKPEWADLLPEWNDERIMIREAMFKTKLAALRASRLYA